MRKTLLASLLASSLFLVGVPALAAGRPADGVRPVPACADIIKGGGPYHDPGGGPDPSGGIDQFGLPSRLPPSQPGSFPAQLMLAAPACSGMTYTIYVLDDDGVTLLASQSVTRYGKDIVAFEEMIIQDEDPAICVYATSSAGAHVFDRMPTEGCTRSDGTLKVDYWWFP